MASSAGVSSSVKPASKGPNPLTFIVIGPTGVSVDSWRRARIRWETSETSAQSASQAGSCLSMTVSCVVASNTVMCMLWCGRQTY
ncbi:hypothetical protein SVIOM74S_03262 [Streptomyces violarus]